MVKIGSWYVAWRRRQIYGRALRGPARAVILRYHSVGEPGRVAEYLDPGLSLTPERFEEQVRFLAKNFDMLGLDALSERLGGTGAFRPAVVITFDDGYRDNHDVAAPILEAAGATATFYVTTSPLRTGRGLWISELWRLAPRLPPGPSGLPEELPQEIPSSAEGRRLLRRRLTRWFAGLTEAEREAQLDHLAKLAGVPRGEGLSESFLTPRMLVALREAGMTVAAHTRSHPHLDHLDPRRHEEEIAGSRKDLEQILEGPVRHFAYPNPSGGGRFGDEARASVAKAGFLTSVTSRPGPLSPEVDRLRLPRLGVYAGAQERLLFSLLARAARR